MIYIPSVSDKSRFVLGKEGKNLLICIGVNPSTATDKKPDPTIRKLKGFARLYGYDGWIMLNLYPKRTPDPNKLPAEMNTYLHYRNLKHIVELLQGISTEPTILAAWGNSVDKRVYLISCLDDIYRKTLHYNPKWKRLGELTEKNNPRHPLFTSYDVSLQDFDIVQYLIKKL